MTTETPPVVGPVTFVPKLFSTLRGYSREQLLKDVTAGVIVGIVALPLAIAFAIASGVTPDRGLITAIVAGFLISVLGGSRVQIGGPTGAFVVIVSGIVAKHGVDGLLVATFLAGVLLIAMGVMKLGGVIKFVPQPVVVGFTSGIAILIFSGQVRDALGLTMATVPPDFFERWQAYAVHIGTTAWPAVGITALTLVILLFWPRVSLKVPGPFVALIVTTALVQLAGIPVETIGSRFGHVGGGLPAPHVPHVTAAMVRDLAGPAFTIALLAAIESLLSAVVADGMIGGKHRSNMELVAQGVANMVSPMFGGIPATGAIARTATNIKSGGRTPIAGITHAIVLLLIALFVGKWAALIPMATLAGILTLVAYHMSEWRNFRAQLRAPRSDVIVLVTTFALTVVVDLTVALQVGMILAAFLFMKRMAEVTNVQAVTRELFDLPEGVDAMDIGLRSVPRGVEVFEIDGPFFFGAAERFKEALGEMGRKPRVLILRLRNVPAIDATGISLLRDLHRRAVRDGTVLMLSGLHSQPLFALERDGLLAEIGESGVFAGVDDALAAARDIVGAPAVPAPGDVHRVVANPTPAGGTPIRRPPRSHPDNR
ncbi:MAG: STAS domain-containing protein [Gemmatimonadaceae bacterium]|nr:STAS domain-containing protein [Gemmatimonadaceae bacterium]